MASLGKDLASVRAHLGYSLQDIQNSTKIPLNTLQAIENGAIFNQSDEIKTYVRSFVRSYGRALKLDDEILVKALNQQEKDKYNHLILENFPELYAEAEPQITSEEEEIPSAGSKGADEDVPKTSSEKSAAETSAPPATEEPQKPAEEEKTQSGFKPAPDPGVRNVNWADMGRRFSIVDQKSTPIWIIGAIIVVILVLAAAYILFENDFFTSETQPAQQTVPEEPIQGNNATQNLQLELSDSPSGESEAAAELDDVLYLTIYAAADKLEPVRIWSDLKPRIDPYWINQGTAFHFEFTDSIRVRGQYSRMLLFLNGHLIENFRQNHFNPAENSIELTRSFFEEDPEWATPVSLELPENVSPPDTVANRPRF